MCDFYLARLPADVHSTASLERLLRSPHHSHGRGRAGQATQPDADIPAARLTMTIHDLMRRDAAEVTPVEYPDTWPFEGNALPIQYRFEPGAPRRRRYGDRAGPVAGGRDIGVRLRGRSLAGGSRGSRRSCARCRKRSGRRSCPCRSTAARAAAELKRRTISQQRWLSGSRGRADAGRGRKTWPRCRCRTHLRLNMRVVDLQGVVACARVAISSN